jgi:hypothetical protein
MTLIAEFRKGVDDRSLRGGSTLSADLKPLPFSSDEEHDEAQMLACDTRSHGTSELTDWRIGNVDDSELRRSVRDPSPP